MRDPVGVVGQRDRTVCVCVLFSRRRKGPNSEPYFIWNRLARFVDGFLLTTQSLDPIVVYPSLFKDGNNSRMRQQFMFVFSFVAMKCFGQNVTPKTRREKSRCLLFQILLSYVLSSKI